ncbi:TPA: LPXTG cell wall anchor domain-containing protein, partial [Bacillus mobilis]
AEVEKPKEEASKPEEEVEKPKEEPSKPEAEVEKPKEEASNPEAEVEKPKEESSEPVTEGSNELGTATVQKNEAVQVPAQAQEVVKQAAKENVSDKQVNKKKEESEKSLAATGGKENNVSLFGGLALVLSALSMFVFRKKLFKK